MVEDAGIGMKFNVVDAIYNNHTFGGGAWTTFLCCPLVLIPCFPRDASRAPCIWAMRVRLQFGMGFFESHCTLG